MIVMMSTLASIRKRLDECRREYTDALKVDYGMRKKTLMAYEFYTDDGTRIMDPVDDYKMDADNYAIYIVALLNVYDRYGWEIPSNGSMPYSVVYDKLFAVEEEMLNYVQSRLTESDCVNAYKTARMHNVYRQVILDVATRM